MTGRAAGYCAGYGVPGYANPAGGFGRGGRGPGFGGRGRGWRHRFYATGLPGWMRYGAVPPAAPAAVEEAAALRRQAELLESSLAEIRERLEQLEKTTDET
jgi:hypothetical protein